MKMNIKISEINNYEFGNFIGDFYDLYNGKIKIDNKVVRIVGAAKTKIMELQHIFGNFDIYYKLGKFYFIIPHNSLEALVFISFTDNGYKYINLKSICLL